MKIRINTVEWKVVFIAIGILTLFVCLMFLLFYLLTNLIFLLIMSIIVFFAILLPILNYHYGTKKTYDFLEVQDNILILTIKGEENLLSMENIKSVGYIKIKFYHYFIPTDCSAGCLKINYFQDSKKQEIISLKNREYKELISSIRKYNFNYEKIYFFDNDWMNPIN